MLDHNASGGACVNIWGKHATPMAPAQLIGSSRRSPHRQKTHPKQPNPFLLFARGESRATPPRALVPKQTLDRTQSHLPVQVPLPPLLERSIPRAPRLALDPRPLPLPVLLLLLLHTSRAWTPPRRRRGRGQSFSVPAMSPWRPPRWRGRWRPFVIAQRWRRRWWRASLRRRWGSSGGRRGGRRGSRCGSGSRPRSAEHGQVFLVCSERRLRLIGWVERMVGIDL